MTLADPRFGAEIITVRGRVLAYDDAGCAAEAIADGEVAEGDVREVWVIDYSRPDRLISSDSAIFVRSQGLRTPMGSGVAATAGRDAARGLAVDLRGTVLDWRGVVAAA